MSGQIATCSNSLKTPDFSTMLCMMYTICWFVGQYEMINGSKSWPDFYFLWYDILFSGTVLPCSTDFVKLLWRTSKTKPWNILAHLWLVSTAWIGHVLFWILKHTATQRYNFIWTSHSLLIWCLSCFHSSMSIIIILVCYFFVLARVILPPLISHFFSHYLLPSLLSPLSFYRLWRHWWSVFCRY